jgi:hypothetical protein
MLLDSSIPLTVTAEGNPNREGRQQPQFGRRLERVLWHG